MIADSCLSKLSNTLDSVPSAIQTLRVITLFSVFGYPDETLPLVFDILCSVPFFIEHWPGRGGFAWVQGGVC